MIFPAPGWLFFLEILPLPEDIASPDKAGAAVLLSLESHSPLPVEHLAHGHIADFPAKKLLYYATARERLRLCVGALYERAAFLLPDFLLAPRKTPGLWHWLATPRALTAVRFNSPADLFPAEVRSWPFPETAAEVPPALRAQTERDARQPLCEGKHAPDTLLWCDAARPARGGKLAALWQSSDNGAFLTAEFPVATAWEADVRERAWLARERKDRAALRRANILLVASAALWLFVALAAILVYFRKNDLRAATARDKAGQTEVDNLNAKAALLARLDEIERGRVSFYDALATLNHFRPPDILFTQAKINAQRQIQIQGVASTTAQINAYVAALRKNGSFSDITESGTTTSGERTSFNLTVTVGNLSVSRGTPPPSFDEINSMIDAFVGGAPSAADPSPPPPPPPPPPDAP